MTPTEFLQKRNIITHDKTDLIIGFDNDTNESLIELIESYHQEKLKLLDLGVVSGSLIGKQIKWHGEIQTIIDVHECGYVVITDKSIPNGVNLHWDSVELVNYH